MEPDDENFDEDVDYTGVEDEETLTPAELGYSGDEDFTPEERRELSPDDDSDTHSPDDPAVETEVDDS